MRNTLQPIYGAIAIAAAALSVQPAEAKYESDSAYPAARCAAFWSGMTRLVPDGSDPHKVMTQRKEAWLTYATQQYGERRANSILNNNGPVYGRQITTSAKETGGMDAIQERFADCEETPTLRAASAPRPAPKAAAKPVITERARNNGDLAIRCAGMARVYANDPLAVSLYGEETVYRQIIDYYRPDLGDDALEPAITAKSQEHARLYIADREKRLANMKAGRKVPEDSYESTRRARECARAVNQLRAVNIIE